MYKQALDLCLQVYGDMSVLSSRLFTNTAILYEESGDQNEAYDLFLKAKKVKVEVGVYTIRDATKAFYLNTFKIV